MKGKKKSRSGKKTRQKKVVLAPMTKNHWIGVACILALTAILFSPSIPNDFVNWDDDVNVYENPALEAFDAANIREIFTSNVIGNYNPLTIFTFAIEKELFGLDKPWIFHLNNLLLHLICVFLVFRFGMLMKLNLPGALFLAILFAIHPMRVESVAWITERKDVLYALFFFVALNRYVKSVRSKKTDHLWIGFFFVLSLLSKIQAVSLPLSMVAVDYFLYKDWKWSRVISKWWLFGLALITGLVGIMFLGDQGSLNNAQLFTIGERFVIGCFSFAVYLIKFIVPYELSPLYPYFDPIPWYAYLGIPVFFMFLAGCYYLFVKKQKLLLFGFGFFFVNIVFLLQFLGAGQGFLADRFTYVAYVGLFFICGYYFRKLWASEAKSKNYILAVISLFLIGYGFLTFNQCKVWKNSDTLWTHVISLYDRTPVPFGNRANYYRDNGRSDEAIKDYSRALELEPDRHSAYNSRGKLYFDLKQFDKALSDYDNAIRISPESGEYYINRGAALANLGRVNEGLEDMNTGLRLKPDHLVGYLNRLVTHNALGQYENALNDAITYLKMNPYAPDIWYEKAVLHRRLGDIKSSRASINRAISINPQKGLYFLELSRVEYTEGNIQKAKSDMERAEALGFNVPQAYKDRFK